MHNNTSECTFMHFSFSDCDERRKTKEEFDSQESGGKNGSTKHRPPKFGDARLFIFRHCFRKSIVSSARKIRCQR